MLLESKQLQSFQKNPWTLKIFKLFGLKSKHLQTSQISLSTLKKLISHALALNIHLSKNKNKKYLQQPNVPLHTSNALKLQSTNPSRSTLQPQSNKISRHFTCMMGLHKLDINKTRYKIAQVYRYIQWHMKDAWNEMISCSPSFAFYCFSSFHWFIHLI